MNNAILNIIVTFAEITVICFSAVVSISLIVSLIKSSHQENKSTKLSYRDNLVDMINDNFKSIKEYYNLYIYPSATSDRRVAYRIYSNSDWKDVSKIYFDTIKVHLKHMPFGFSNFWVKYTLTDYNANPYSIDRFMIDNNLDEDNRTALFYNNMHTGCLIIQKFNSSFYRINILEDVGIDKYINISFEYRHNLNDKVLNTIIQKVII